VYFICSDVADAAPDAVVVVATAGRSRDDRPTKPLLRELVVAGAKPLTSAPGKMARRRAILIVASK
jgi:hypothetical protein